MGRLIDADELLAQIRQIDFLKTPNSTKLSACEIMEIVNRQPTAYDVETVCLQMLEKHIRGLTIDKVIEIVKAGGIDG